MEFCNQCDALLHIDVNVPQYVCHHCLAVTPLTGLVELRRERSNLAEDPSIYDTRLSARDPINARVLQTCPTCQRPFLTSAIFNGSYVLLCPCGYSEQYIPA
jgi:DNA-directed RNA polymerase subunit M/transcription elongation factor TFIIS